jgi:hypothetical protein
VSSAKNVLREFIGLQSELAVKKLYANSVDFRRAITLYQECGFSSARSCRTTPATFRS